MRKTYRVSDINGSFCIGLVFLGASIAGSSWMLFAAAIALIGCGFIGVKFSKESE